MSTIIFLIVLVLVIRLWWKVNQGMLGKQPTRRVGTLDHGEDDVDKVREVVSTTPEPIKPGRLRMTYRDVRLLPKPQRDRYDRWNRQRKRFFTADYANRLFAATLRTRNRKVRDLLEDAGQLKRYQLPQWKSEEELANALQISVKTLRHYSMHKQRDEITHYVSFARPKRSGGWRIIMAPKTRLKKIQRRLLTELIEKLPVSDYAHGFRKGRSIATHAQPHTGRAVVMRIDLKDFFPTIHAGRVRGYLLGLGYSYPVAATLAALMTEAPRQPVVTVEGTYYPTVGSRSCPQGAPTSPGIANAIAMKLDHRLAGIARKMGFAYTRYADDLTFSGDDYGAVKALYAQVARIVKEEGFTVNADKTLVMRRGSRQQVTGVTVNQATGLSRKERRRLRAQVHQWGKAQAAGNADAQLGRVLRGKIAFVSMLNRAHARLVRGKTSL